MARPLLDDSDMDREINLFRTRSMLIAHPVAGALVDIDRETDDDGFDLRFPDGFVPCPLPPRGKLLVGTRVALVLAPNNVARVCTHPLNDSRLSVGTMFVTDSDVGELFVYVENVGEHDVLLIPGMCLARVTLLEVGDVSTLHVIFARPPECEGGCGKNKRL